MRLPAVTLAVTPVFTTSFLASLYPSGSASGLGTQLLTL